jgi:hypothetical protein
MAGDDLQVGRPLETQDRDASATEARFRSPFVSASGPRSPGECAHGLQLFARIDHAAGARTADVELEANVLLIFGNTRVGTP